MPDSGLAFATGESWKSGSAGKRERMATYVDWLLTPESERTPKTKKDLADLLGITPATLRNYTQDAWLQKEIGNRAKATAKIERLPEILDSLFNQAVDEQNPRSVAAAGKYLDYLTKTEEVRETADLTEMSDEDLVKLLSEILQRTASAE